MRLALLACVTACVDESPRATFSAQFADPSAYATYEGARVTEISEAFASYELARQATFELVITTSSGESNAVLTPGYCAGKGVGDVTSEERLYSSLHLPLMQSELACSGTDGSVLITD